MRADERIADFPAGPAFGRQITKCEEVAERLAHLLAFDEQVRVVEPETRERLTGRSFALGDLVFVVRKDQIFAAAMNVERLTEMFHAHDATFDVPPGSAFAPRRRPLNRTVGFD